jgi:hypothetical protein
MEHLLLVNYGRIPNYVRPVMSVRIGKFLIDKDVEPVPRVWWRDLLQFFDDLHYYDAVREEFLDGPPGHLSTRQPVGWYSFCPETVLITERYAATMGNSVARRGAASKLHWRENLIVKHPLSYAVVLALLADRWKVCARQGQGAEWDIPLWTFIQHDPEQVKEEIALHTAHVEPEDALPVLTLDAPEVELDSLEVEVSVDKEKGSVGKGTEGPEQEEPEREREVRKQEHDAGEASDRRARAEDEESDDDSPADEDADAREKRIGKQREDRPARAEEEEDHEEEKEDEYEEDAPEKEVKNIKTVNPEVVRRFNDADPLVNDRPDPVQLNFDYEDGKIGVEPFEPCYILASRAVGQEEVAPIGDTPVSVTFNEEKGKVESTSGCCVLNKFQGAEPVTNDSSTPSIYNTINCRLTKSGARGKAKTCRQGRTYTRIKLSENGELKTPFFFPHWLRLTKEESDFISGVEISENTESLIELMKNMAPASRNRMMRLLHKYNIVLTDLEDAFKEIKLFIKSNDKTFKNKPRLIQFVDSAHWLRSVLTITAILHNIKNSGNKGEPWGWFDPKTEKRYVWASGMTVKQLADAYNWVEANCEDAIFICGDDNTDRKSCKDATAYDASQKGYFFDAQGCVLREMGFAKEAIEYMAELHLVGKVGGGFTVKLFDKILPTGCPWTLFLNTVGLVVFATQRHYVERKGGGADSTAIAAELLGLVMKEEDNPFQDGADFGGSEFLKMAVIEIHGRHYPCPLPSRVVKWGARNSASIQDGRKQLPQAAALAHLASVARGQHGFLLDPFILGPYVEGWSKEATRGKIYDPGYVNINASEPLVLAAEDRGKWTDKWVEFYDTRYGISHNELIQMREAIKNGVGKTMQYKGNVWSKLVARDYLGESPHIL